MAIFFWFSNPSLGWGAFPFSISSQSEEMPLLCKAKEQRRKWNSPILFLKLFWWREHSCPCLVAQSSYFPDLADFCPWGWVRGLTISVILIGKVWYVFMLIFFLVAMSCLGSPGEMGGYINFIIKSWLV